MVDQGTLTELINASTVSLRIGSDTFLQLQDITINFGKPEFREPVWGSAVYFFGEDDTYIEGTILATSPEINTLVGFIAGTTSTSYRLSYTDASSNSRNITVNGVMTPLRIEKPIEGAVKFRIRIRVTTKTTASIVSS